MTDEKDNNVISIFGGQDVESPVGLTDQFKIDPKEVLEKAKEFDHDEVMVIGYNSQDSYIASSTTNIKEILFLKFLIGKMMGEDE